MKQLKLLMFVVCACLALTACGGDGNEEGDGGLTKVRFGVGAIPPVPEIAHYSTLPIGLGYWEDEGLDVELMGFKGGLAVIQALDAGRIDVGSSGGAITAAASGTDIVTFFNSITGPYNTPVVPESSDIRTLKDLAESRIGVQSLDSSTIPFIRAIGGRELGSADDMNLLPIGVGAEALAFLENGEIDSVGLWDGQHALLSKLGDEPLRQVTAPWFEAIGFHGGLYANAETIERDRGILVGIGRGVAKATLFAQTNPEAAVRIHWEVEPDSKPVGVDDAEALDLAVTGLKARLANSEPVEDLWGNATVEQIMAHLDILEEAGVIDRRPDISELWTDELIAEINDFDHQEVIDAANNWKP